MSRRRLLWLLVPLLIAANKPPPPPPQPPPSVRLGVEKWRIGDYNASVMIWAPFAQAGDTDALFNMGQAYKLGRGVPVDMARARAYYAAAAAKGSLPGQANLGIMLLQAGEKPEALRWLKMAADRGEPRAQYVLGVATFNGDGTRRSKPLGYAYLLRASATGLTQATATLASIEPTLTYPDRSSGEAIAASLAAGTGVPTAFNSGTPQVIANPHPSRPPTPVQIPAPLSVIQAPVIQAPVLQAPAAQKPPAPLPVAQPLAVMPEPVAPPKLVVPPLSVQKPVPVPAKVPLVVPPPAATPKPKAENVETPPATAVAKPAAAPKPAAAKPAASKPVPTGWRVQLGAFATVARAEAAWAATRKAVSDLPGSGKPAYAEGDGIVKLQLGPFSSKAEAQKACTQLSAAGRACFTVAP